MDGYLSIYLSTIWSESLPGSALNKDWGWIYREIYIPGYCTNFNIWGKKTVVNKWKTFNFRGEGEESKTIIIRVRKHIKLKKLGMGKEDKKGDRWMDGYWINQHNSGGNY